MGSAAWLFEAAAVGSFIVPPFHRITRTAGWPGSLARLKPASSAVWSAARRSISPCCPPSQCSIAWSIANCDFASAGPGFAYVAGRAAGSVCWYRSAVCLLERASALRLRPGSQPQALPPEDPASASWPAAARVRVLTRPSPLTSNRVT